MKLKKSNKALLILLLFLLAGAIVTDYLLAVNYTNINVRDPLRNFELVRIKPFKNLKISGGNSYSVELRRADSFSIQLLSSRKSFFDLKQSGDSLIIQFSVAARTANQPYDPVKGLIIYAPVLSDVEFAGTSATVIGFKQDSLAITQLAKSKTAIQSLHTRALSIRADGQSVFDFQNNCDVDALSLQLNNNATALLNGIRFKSIAPVIGENSAMVLGSQNFKHGVSILPGH